jgi:hypothetical protein
MRDSIGITEVSCEVVPFRPELRRKYDNNTRRTISPSRNTQLEKRDGKLTKDQHSSFNMLARSKVEITTSRKKFAQKYISNVFNSEGNEEQRRLRK